MSEFEAYQLMIFNLDTINDQFEFLMTTTFAVVVASYTAGNRLAIWARVVISTLYVLAVYLFYIRWQSAVPALGSLGQILAELGFEGALPTRFAPLAQKLRLTAMIGGTLMAIVLICLPDIASRISRNKNYV